MNKQNPREIKVALLGQRDRNLTRGWLERLAPSVEFVAPENADITIINSYERDQYQPAAEYKADLQKLSAAAAKAKQLLAVVDSPEIASLVASLSLPTVRFATVYGASADWHLAITSQQLRATSFVLQGAADSYFRGRIETAGTLSVRAFAAAMIALEILGYNVKDRLDELGGTTFAAVSGSGLELAAVSDLEKVFTTAVKTAAATGDVLNNILDVVPEDLVAICAPAGFAADPPQTNTEFICGAYYAQNCARLLLVGQDSGESQFAKGALAANCDTKIEYFADVETAVAAAAERGANQTILLALAAGENLAAIQILKAGGL